MAKIVIKSLPFGEPGIIDNGIPDEMELSYLRVRYGADCTLLQKEEQINVEITLSYVFKGKTIYSFSLLNPFEVADMENLVQYHPEMGNITFKNDILPIIVLSAFNATRGYMAAKVEKTLLKVLPFPLLSERELMKTCNLEME